MYSETKQLSVAVITISVVEVVQILNPGSGYITAPTVTFSGGGGIGGVAAASN